MRSFYAQFWPWRSKASMRKAVILSIVLHGALIVLLTVRFPQRLQLTHAGGFTVDLTNPSGPPADAPPLGTPDAPALKEPPKPAPPPPAAEKKDPEPPPKEQPKPKPKPKPVEEAKVEKPKEKPKEEKPKEVKKAEPKKEPQKTKPKEEKEPVERVKVAKNVPPARDIPDNPLDDLSPLDEMSPMDDVRQTGSTRAGRRETPMPRGIPTGKAGISMAGGIPSALGAWGGNVQRKVESEWKIPEGIVLGPIDDGAVISFWVSRTGQLIGDPKVEKHAVDPEVAESAIRAIRSAVPYPPLPDSFGDAEVQVFYTFIPVK